MPKVVSNTTPVLSLLKIDRLQLLRELYGEIHIPKAVFLEIETGKNKPYYHDLSSLKWIKITEIQNIEPLKFLIDLDLGEAETLVLAKELNADLVIMDEVLGRRFAKELGLKLTGTIGILLKAKEKGIIPSLKPLLDELISKGTWLSPKLISKALTIAGEK